MAQSTIAGASSSFSTDNGHIVFPNGLKMCWGVTPKMTVPANSTATVEVTYPIKFTLRPLVVVSAFTNSDAAGGCPNVAQALETTEGCTLKAFNTNTSSRTPYINWFAIGY